MKTTFKYIMLLAIGLTFVGCNKEDGESSATELPISEACITDSVRYNESHMTAYNFIYPSTDPYGQPVMLSGTITLGDSVKAHAHAAALLLYNHFTIYRADQCPSRGSLAEQKIIASINIITISPDYYGFGITENKHQAYCISQANAQASVDALLGAKKILAAKGYTWGNLLFNGGYSQGGQTTMGVVRLVAEKYPDIDITFSFAGAGSYDIPETYRQFVIDTTAVGIPSTVISVMLAYNEYKNLGISRKELFIEPVLSHIDDWILSKRYTNQEIDSLIGPLTIAQYASSAVLDTSSEVSKKLVTALELENICKGWIPRGNERLMLFHSSRDNTVPAVNTQKMYDFLTAHGVPAENIDLQILDIDGTADTPAHKKAAETFFFKALVKVASLLAEAS